MPFTEDTILDPERFAQVVARNIKSLLAMRDVHAKELAQAIGASETQLSQRMGGHSRWLAIDLHRIAAVLDCTVDALIAPDANEFVEALSRSRCFPGSALVTDLPVVHPGQGTLALAS